MSAAGDGDGGDDNNNSENDLGGGTPQHEHERRRRRRHGAPPDAKSIGPAAAAPLGRHRSSNSSSNSNNRPAPPATTPATTTTTAAAAAAHRPRHHHGRRQRFATQRYPAIYKPAVDQELLKLALHRNAFFTCLDEEQIERLVRVARLQRFAPGQVVIMEGCVDRDDEEEGDDDHDAAAAAAQRTEPSNGAGGLWSRIRGGKRNNNDLASHEQEENDGAETDDETDDTDNNSNTNNPQEGILQQQQQPLVAAVPAASALVTATEATKVLHHHHHPAAPKLSNVPRALYIIKSGHADVWYNHQDTIDGKNNKPSFNPASLGPASLFGTGGFLFGRAHSASVVASRHEPLECYVIDIATFRHYVLPSDNMKSHFAQYASHVDDHGESYMSMEDFVAASCDDVPTMNSDIAADGGVAAGNVEAATITASAPTMPDPMVSLRIANTYNILRKQQRRNHQSNSNDEDESLQSPPPPPPPIYLDDFCVFHLLMARPDPEVDIAFLLMDQKQTGQISLGDLEQFLQNSQVDLGSEFFERYFGSGGGQYNDDDDSDGDDDADNDHHAPLSWPRHGIRDVHFSQFLVDLQREMGQQAFLRVVEQHGTDAGYVPPRYFVQALKTSCGWRLPQGVADRLESLYCSASLAAGEAAALVSLRAGSLKRHSNFEVTKATEKSVLADMEQREKNLGNRYFAYGDFVAFQEVLGNLPGICNLIDRAQEIKQGSPISPDDFKVANRVMGFGARLSRLQVDIIFQLFDLDRDGYVSHEDTVSVCGVDLAQRLEPVLGRDGKLTFAPPPDYSTRMTTTTTTDAAAAVEAGSETSSSGLKTGTRVQHFGLMAVAATLGVVALYPLDLVKTRLMNQRILLNVTDSKQPQPLPMYRNSLDCLRTVWRHESWRGLYRGLSPQLLGLAPEKAIKLQVNALLRQAFANKDGGGSSTNNNGRLDLPFEVLAGACAGACQLLVTNPMEITKIRLQMQGETVRLLRRAQNLTPPAQPPTLFGVAQDLGFAGLWRGASACLLRDVPFSAIYFPTYTFCKEMLTAGHEGSIRPADLLVAGTVAGIPAAWLTTPADVIKTRLQVGPRWPGEEQAFAGIRDCATHLWQHEGYASFFRGAGPRVARIAPQFGITLLAYEQLSSWVGLQPSAPPTNAFVDPYDYRKAFPARSQLSPKTTDIDGWIQSFGTQPSSEKDSDNSRGGRGR